MVQTNRSFTREIASYIARGARADVTDDLLFHAKIALLDWFSVSVAARDEPLVRALLRNTARFGGQAQASLVGYDLKYSAPQAALINGAMSHALDYDDNLRHFMGHPTVAIMPAVLAAGEWRGATGRDILGAYMCGLKVGVWVAQSMGVEHYQVGFHGTSTIGRQAAAAACAYLLNLNETQTLNALGVAGTLANGVKQSFGTMAKPLHAGVAAEGGLLAASLAEDGFEAAHDIYEGALGFIATHHGDNAVVDWAFLNGSHPVELLELKFHAACFFLHGAINVAQKIKAENGLTPSDIQMIEVWISKLSCDTAGKEEPITGLDGKFSMKYSLANVFVTGDTGVSGYTDEKVNDPKVRAVTERITVHITDKYDATPLTAKVRVVLRDGRDFEGEADPLDQSLSLDEKQEKLAAKFYDLCVPQLGQARAEELFQAVHRFEEAAAPDGALALSRPG